MFLPHPLSHALSKETPGEEKQYEDARDYPARSLDQHLQEVNL